MQIIIVVIICAHIIVVVINQEQNSQFPFLAFMPRLSFAYAKIMQIESRIIQVLLERYAEMQLSLCKDNANQMQVKIKSSIFMLLPHVTPNKPIKQRFCQHIYDLFIFMIVQ